MGGFWSSVASVIPGVSNTQQHRRNKREAQKDRDFQERMSSTAYQRGVKDMEDAGLNPALMYGGGASAASSPGGSKADVDRGTGGVVSSAMQAKRLGQEISNMRAEGDRARALADREEATNVAYGITYDPKGQMIVNPNKNMPNLVSMIHAQINSAKAQAAGANLGLVGMRNMAGIQGSWAGGPLEAGRQLMTTILGRQLQQRLR